MLSLTVAVNYYGFRSGFVSAFQVAGAALRCQVPASQQTQCD